MYEYVLFDLDGTISDSSEGIFNGISLALKHYGIELDRQELRKFIGPPLTYSFSNFCGFNDEQIDTAVKIYREYYAEQGLHENRAYDGIAELLKKVKESGRKVAIATSKPSAFSEKILDGFGLMPYLDVIAGATMDGEPGKVRADKKDVVEYALERFGNPDKSKVVLVGDTKFDADGAAEVGIDCIGVLYGFGTEDSLREHGAKYIANTVEDIYQYL